jgi:hypothetical protein
MKPTLKAPKSKLLNLEHEKVLSKCGFKFNLRRYSLALSHTFYPPLCNAIHHWAGG